MGGSSEQVRRHDAIGICGGELNAYALCSELLDLLFRRVLYVGGSGSASRMKLVLNLVLALNRAVLAEGLSFAIANGIDAQAAIEVLRAGPASGSCERVLRAGPASGSCERVLRTPQ